MAPVSPPPSVPCRAMSPIERAGGRTSSMSKREQVRMALAGAAVVLAIVFALVNLDKVKVNWIVTTSQTPLIVVIAVSFVLGSLAGALVWRARARR